MDATVLMSNLTGAIGIVGGFAAVAIVARTFWWVGAAFFQWLNGLWHSTAVGIATSMTDEDRKRASDNYYSEIGRKKMNDMGFRQRDDGTWY